MQFSLNSRIYLLSAATVCELLFVYVNALAEKQKQLQNQLIRSGGGCFRRQLTESEGIREISKNISSIIEQGARRKEQAVGRQSSVQDMRT